MRRFLSSAPAACRLPSASHWPLIALFAGGLFIGCGPIFVRLSETSPVATAFWRLLLAQPFLWILFARQHRRDAGKTSPRTARDMGRMALVGFFFCGDLAVWHWSIKLTSVANATLLGNFAPGFVALFVWLLYKQKPARSFLGGMSVAWVGLFFLMQGSSAPTKTGGANPLLGDVLGLVTAAFYASYMLSAKAVRSDFSAAALMAWSGAFCSIFLGICAWLSGGILVPQTLSGWLPLLALAFITHAAGQTLITYSLAHLSATFSSIGLLIQPVAAAFLAWLWLGESIAWPQFVGGALVLAGIVLARRA
jgi:drug/metabolite transporter (DMT)-like permease